MHWQYAGIMRKYLASKIILIAFAFLSGFSCLYGIENVVDVTKKVSESISFDIKADKSLAEELTYDGPRILRIDYTVKDRLYANSVIVRGELFTDAIAEGQTLNLSMLSAGKIEIIHANYGAIDFPVLNVTDALNKRIRDEKLSFVVNKTLTNGVDPYPDKSKELRIKYSVGDEIFVEAFAEGEQVVLPRDGKTGIIVLRATYGNHSAPIPPVEDLYGLPKGMLDVTDLVKQGMKNNTLNVKIDKKFTEDKDPAQNKVKVLRLDYKIGDELHADAFLEGETITLSPSKPLSVIQAAYGIVPFPVLHVTENLQSKVNNNALKIVVNNKNISKGIDPIFGRIKALKVTYAVDQREFSVTVNEDDTLSLPKAGDGKGKLVIRKATYGDHSASTPRMPK